MHKSGPRKTYFDIMRMIAIFFVLYAHTDLRAIHHYMIEGGAFSYWAALALQQFSYINNATFFLISGALLLGREEDLKTLWSRRVLKYLLIIIVFGFIQYCYNYYQNPDIGFDLKIILKCLYSDNIVTSYWFLHAYLVLMLMLPFLRILARNLSDTLGIYLAGGVFFINGILPLVEILWENSRIALSFPIFESILFYPLLGYLLETRWYEHMVKGKRLLFWNLSGILAWAFSVWYTYQMMLLGQNYADAGGLTLILVITVYLDVRFLCEKCISCSGTQKPGRMQRILSVFGKGTFVVYLFNNILSDMLVFIYDAVYLKVTWFGAAVLWLGSVISAGVLISFLYETVKDFLIQRFCLDKQR